ncbi:hypothetical protein [Ochrobactrum sp. BTU1]|uniref:hypothetical protein n=1 Tax=Ochrobactrum sp. BTU1 TaxID=2840456 RepID=UPI001C05BE9F|nr:hypothetical protein KMS41_05090 [Ochrobactrum sp. BTU1]
MRLLTLAVSVCLALTLSGCATFGTKLSAPVYPELPADLRLCFDKEVPQPKQGPLTKKQVIALIASLKTSEAEKTACGKRLIAFYDNLSK